MSTNSKPRLSSWAQLRFSIVGGLLARPPAAGELCKRLEILAGQSYQHPTKDSLVTFGISTIERWYYKALKSYNPVEALGRKPRSDIGENKAMSSALLLELGRQYKMFSNWSYKLHSDNLTALVEERPELGDLPSYSTVQRRMKERGWYPNVLDQIHCLPWEAEYVLERCWNLTKNKTCIIILNIVLNKLVPRSL